MQQRPVNDTRIRAIAERLKEEVFVELDERIREAEDSLSDQINDQLDEQFIEQRERLNARLSKKLRTFQQNLEGQHKVPYMFMVVPGFLLFWYGAWDIIRVIPILNNGIVAFVAGIVLLLITGTIYRKLVG